MAARVTLHQRRAQETRQFILDAAYRVVSRRGYGEATVEEIAEDAGVSMGALYYHFPSKEKLFRSLAEDHVHRTVHSLPELPPDAAFPEVVETFVSFWLDHVQAEAASRPLTLELWAQATRQDWAHDEVSASFRRFLDITAAMLRMGQDAGIVRRDLEIEMMAFLVVSALEGVSLQHAIDPALSNLEAAKRPLADFIERFILATPGGGGTA